MLFWPLNSQLLLQEHPQLQVMTGIAPFVSLSAWKWKLSCFHRKCFLPLDQSASVALLWEQQRSRHVYVNFGLCRSCWLSPVLLLELLVFGDFAGNHISWIRIKLLCSFQVYVCVWSVSERCSNVLKILYCYL